MGVVKAWLRYNKERVAPGLVASFFSLQRMPGGVGKNKGAGGGGAVHQKSRHVKAKKQKKRFMRAKDPIQAVFMWGIQHSVRETSHALSHSILPSFRSMKSRYSLSLLYY